MEKSTIDSMDVDLTDSIEEQLRAVRELSQNLKELKDTTHKIKIENMGSTGSVQSDIEGSSECDEEDNHSIQGSSGESEEDDPDHEIVQKTLKELQRLEQKRLTHLLTFKEAAMYVLWKSQRLMTSNEIISNALEMKLCTTGGRTPHATIASLINTDISKKGKNSVFAKFGAGQFSVKPNFVKHISNNIISPKEQQLGMVLMKGSALPYIPFESESNWVEIRESQLRGSGMGLYAKHKIQDHIAFSEYKGRIRKIDSDESKESELTSPSKKAKTGDAEVHPYGVGVTMGDGTSMMVDGLAEDGSTVLSYAPRANDAGPIYANCMLAEYLEFPGRVFLESTREIKAGEEIFVMYGPNYWNVKQYPYLPTLEMYGDMPYWANRSKKCFSTLPILDDSDEDDEPSNKIPAPNYSCKTSECGMKISLRKLE